MLSPVKATLRRSVRSWMLSPGFYACYRQTLLRWSDYFQIQRAAAVSEAARQALDRASPGQRVLHGPFAGMVYPGHHAVGSSFPPKLIGSYEHEIHPFIERLLRKDFPLIVDIGCAEGYYAVGFALHCPDSKVVAYDLAPEARSLCQKMAALNGVADRISIGDYCDAAALGQIAHDKTCLIFCDCEGHEEWLFTPQTISRLGRATLLIETHDFMSPGLTDRLVRAFANTHHCERIAVGSPAARKAKFRDLLASATNREWLLDHLLDEGRPSDQCWLLLSPAHPLSPT